ncbi:MAG: DUF3822 family protein [Paludibacter sp.]|nr:DUF3822 family protein [Paludibacter sp.]
MEDSSVPKYNNQYSLSIRFSSDGFSLLIYDELKKLLTAKTVPVDLTTIHYEDLIELLLDDVETILNIKKIRLIYESDTYAFVPASIFRAEHATDFLFFQDKLNKSDKISFNKLPNWDTVDIFTVPAVLNDAMAHLFPRLEIEHHLSWFLSGKIKSTGESSVQIWVRPKIMDVVVLNNGNIVLINSYDYSTPEDFTYFTLNIFQQLALNKEECPVKLYNSESCTEMKQHLQKYLKSVSCEQ